MIGDTAYPTELGDIERRMSGSTDLPSVERQRGQ